MNAFASVPIFFSLRTSSERTEDDQWTHGQAAQSQRVVRDQRGVEPARGPTETSGKKKPPKPRCQRPGKSGVLVQKLSLSLSLAILRLLFPRRLVPAPPDLSAIFFLPSLCRPRFRLLLSALFKPCLRPDDCGGLVQLSPAHRSAGAALVSDDGKHPGENVFICVFYSRRRSKSASTPLLAGAHKQNKGWSPLFRS